MKNTLKPLAARPRLLICFALSSKCMASGAYCRDLMCFSLILSMACQTADVQITEGAMRRLVLLHSVMAFFFNVVIISITINTLSGGL